MIEPIVWEKFGDNLQIMDIPNKRQIEVKKLMFEHYLKPNVIYDLIDFTKDNEAVDAYFKFLDHCLYDEVSLIVMDTAKDKIVGCALAKVMKQDLRSWTALRVYFDSDKLNIFLDMHRNLVFTEQPGYRPKLTAHSDTLHIFGIAVAPHLDGVLWKERLLEVARYDASCLKLPNLTYVALLSVEQQAAERAGLKERTRAYYTGYTNEKGKRPFLRGNADEFFAALYGVTVEPLIIRGQLRD